MVYVSLDFRNRCVLCYRGTKGHFSKRDRVLQLKPQTTKN